MFAVFKEVATLTFVPVLLFVAWWEWLGSLRALLPPWRNAIALISLLIISVNWIVALLLDIPSLFHVSTLVPVGTTPAIYLLAHPLGIVAAVFAFALMRKARLGALLGSIILLVCWPGGYF